MIAPQKDRLSGALAIQQQIEHLPRAWSAVDIVADKDQNRTAARIKRAVSVDLRQQRFQQVGAAMNIPDRIHPQSIGQSRCRAFGP